MMISRKGFIASIAAVLHPRTSEKPHKQPWVGDIEADRFYPPELRTIVYDRKRKKRLAIFLDGKEVRLCFAAYEGNPGFVGDHPPNADGKQPYVDHTGEDVVRRFRSGHVEIRIVENS